MFQRKVIQRRVFPTQTFEEDNALRSPTNPSILLAFLTPTELFLTSYKKPHTDNRPASNTHSGAATCTYDYQASVNWIACITCLLNDSVMAVLMINIQFSDTNKSTTFFPTIHSTLEHRQPVLLCLTCSCPHEVQQDTLSIKFTPEKIETQQKMLYIIIIKPLYWDFIHYILL